MSCSLFTIADHLSLRVALSGDGERSTLASFTKGLDKHGKKSPGKRRVEDVRRAGRRALGLGRAAVGYDSGRTKPSNLGKGTGKCPL